MPKPSIPKPSIPKPSIPKQDAKTTEQKYQSIKEKLIDLGHIEKLQIENILSVINNATQSAKGSINFNEQDNNNGSHHVAGGVMETTSQVLENLASNKGYKNQTPGERKNTTTPGRTDLFMTEFPIANLLAMYVFKDERKISKVLTEFKNTDELEEELEKQFLLMKIMDEEKSSDAKNPINVMKSRYKKIFKYHRMEDNDKNKYTDFHCLEYCIDCELNLLNKLKKTPNLPKNEEAIKRCKSRINEYLKMKNIDICTKNYEKMQEKMKEKMQEEMQEKKKEKSLSAQYREDQGKNESKKVLSKKTNQVIERAMQAVQGLDLDNLIGDIKGYMEIANQRPEKKQGLLSDLFEKWEIIKQRIDNLPREATIPPEIQQKLKETNFFKENDEDSIDIAYLQSGKMHERHQHHAANLAKQAADVVPKAFDLVVKGDPKAPDLKAFQDNHFYHIQNILELANTQPCSASIAAKEVVLEAFKNSNFPLDINQDIPALYASMINIYKNHD